MSRNEDELCEINNIVGKFRNNSLLLKVIRSI